MQHHLVGLVTDRAQYRALGEIGIGQQGQRLVAVTGQHQLIEAFQPGSAVHAHAMLVALHAEHRALQAFTHLPAAAQRVDIPR
ncbi:hypothetical protein D3C85_1699960 [compost metagenome]